MNFLGVMTNGSFWTPYVREAQQYADNRCVKTDYPAFDEEYFEWVDLLEAVAAAEERFTMIELGAGWGRWIANAAAALKQRNDLPYTLIAIEAEPTHFQWMIDHLQYNGIDARNCRLIRAAVADRDGRIGFHTGRVSGMAPGEYYGQAIGGPTEVDAVSLDTLLRPLEKVDLIDVDLQGAEFGVLDAATEQLDQKVKKVHIGTHGRKVHAALESLFARLGWKNLYSYPDQCISETKWGTISFQDGVQGWLNPKYIRRPSAGDLADLQQTRLLNEIALFQEKFKASRQEGARLWVQVEQLQAELDQTGARRKSVGQRLANRCRSVRDLLAQGTHRRTLVDSVSRSLRGGVGLTPENHKVARRLACGLGRKLHSAGNRLARFGGTSGVWIDVGAHLGERTLQFARENPSVTVFAFEPNWGVAKQMMGLLSNFVVLPFAVSEVDGFSEFFYNVADAASSLLPLNPEGLKNWVGGEALRVQSIALVPTIRLDTFMRRIGIRKVEYLKVDAQGADFAVIKSAGERIVDIHRIMLEVDVAPVRLYEGSATKDEIVSYLEQKGFQIARSVSQNCAQEENLTFVRSS